MPRLPQIYTDEQKRRGYELYVTGLQLKQVAEQLNIPLHAVRSWSFKGHWKARKEESEQSQKGLVRRLHGEKGAMITANDNGDPDAELIAELEAMSFEQKQERFRRDMAALALRIPDIMAAMSYDELLKHADKLHKLDGIARRALNLEEPTPAPVVHIDLLSANGTLPPLIKPSEPESERGEAGGSDQLPSRSDMET